MPLLLPNGIYGTLSTEEITDEGLINKIKDYENWYGKIKDCKQELKDLKEQQQEIAITSLEGIQSFYDRRIDFNSSRSANFEAQIEKKEAFGGNATSNDYKNLITATRKEQAYNQNKRTELSKQLDRMVAINKKSEVWGRNSAVWAE